MSGMINELINIMEDQVVCYEYLLGLSDEKRNVLINNDIENLQKITELENKVISQNIGLEKKRLAVISDIAYILNIDLEIITISRILLLIKDQQGYDELLKVSKDMRDIIELLKDSNEQNKMLINNSMNYIDYTMNAIQSTFETEATIENREYTSASFFDARQ